MRGTFACMVAACAIPFLGMAHLLTDVAVFLAACAEALMGDDLE